jgi:hypothetical protein
MKTTEEHVIILLHSRIDKLLDEKDELLDFIRNIEDTNLDELLDVKIPEILEKFKEEL